MKPIHLYRIRMIGAVAMMGYGFYQIHSVHGRSSFGVIMAGLGAYLFWRNWQRSKNPPPTLPEFKYTDALFWSAVLLAGFLLWFAVKAR